VSTRVHVRPEHLDAATLHRRDGRQDRQACEPCCRLGGHRSPMLNPVRQACKPRCWHPGPLGPSVGCALGSRWTSKHTSRKSLVFSALSFFRFRQETDLLSPALDPTLTLGADGAGLRLLSLLFSVRRLESAR
jgi:hypothetical protein